MNIKFERNKFIENYLWIILSAIGVVGFICIVLFMPMKQAIDQEWQFYFKIFIFLIISFGVGFFPNKHKQLYLLIFIPFLVVLGIIISRIAYMGVVMFPEEEIKPFDQYYSFLYFILYPFITLIAGFAYRLGGGSTGNTVKIIFGGQIFLFSGYLDIMWLLVNRAEIPEIMIYAHHIKIVIGHFPTFRETIIFALCHIPLFAILLALPLNKWINKIYVKENLTDNKQVTLEK